MTKNLIPNAFVRWHFSALHRQPESVAQICASVGISLDQLQGPGSLLAADQYADLLKTTVRHLDDEAFGALSRHIKQGSFALMAHACIDCKTLKQVIHRMLLFYRIVSDELDWQWHVNGDQAMLRFTTNATGNSDYFTAFMMSVSWRWLSWIIDKPIPLDRADFTQQQPDFAGEIIQVFKAPLHFEADSNQLVFPADYLKLNVTQTPESLNTFLINTPEYLLSHYKEDLSLSRKVRHFIESHDHAFQLILADVAREFNLSEQSLIRGLKQEGQKFTTLRDNLRKQRARYLLLKTRDPVGQISSALGFSEEATFYRRFKQWFGMTPRQYRQAQGSSQG